MAEKQYRIVDNATEVYYADDDGNVHAAGNITVDGTVDGRDVAADGTKLDTIETNATADQTAADIRALGFFDTTNDGSGSGLDADLLDGTHLAALATGADLSAHEADTTSIHGIADTSALLDTGDIGVTVQGYDADLAALATNGVVSQAEAEAGVATTERIWTAQRVKQAIAALETTAPVDSVNGATGAVVLDADDIDDAATAHKFATSAQLAKVDWLTVTQAVDLDQMESDIAALDQAVVLQGTWDASSGSFPGGGTAQSGASWIVSVGGTVDGEVFVANDRILAITDNASTTVYASNWHKLDYTDQVLSVNSQTGAVVLDADDIDDSATTNKFADTASVTAAGALMDSEVTNLAQVKAFNSADYATAAQGATADSALQNVVEDTTPQLGGDLDTNGNDLTGGLRATDGSDVLLGTQGPGVRIDGSPVGVSLVAGTGIVEIGNIAAGTDTLAFDSNDIQARNAGSSATLNLNANGGTVHHGGDITVAGTVDGRDVAADGTKLDGIESGADVTDTTNVTAAGALMDSEVTNLAQVKAFNSADYATAAQGTTADSAVQPGDNVSVLTNDAGYITSAGSGISNVVEDLTPQLGGNLDLNGNEITGATVKTGSTAGNNEVESVGGNVVIDSADRFVVNADTDVIYRTDEHIYGSVATANIVNSAVRQVTLTDGVAYDLDWTDEQCMVMVMVRRKGQGGAAGLWVANKIGTYNNPVIVQLFSMAGASGETLSLDYPYGINYPNVTLDGATGTYSIWTQRMVG